LGPHLFPSFTTHAGKIPLPPLGRSYSEQKNHFAIGRNSERRCYHTDLSRFVLPISDPSALNFSQFVGLQNSPNLSKIEKVAETCEFDGKESLFVERAIAISIKVLGGDPLTYFPILVRGVDPPTKFSEIAFGAGIPSKGGRLFGQGVPLMLATWMRFSKVGCCPDACHACCCAHPCCCCCVCVAFYCCWWICRRCCEAPLDIWGA